jgi:pyruvate kinase
VATLGPATADPGVLRRLIEAGVDVVRLNLAHGSLDDHRRTAERVREVAEETGRVVATLVDLPGPKPRTGPFPRDGVALDEGQVIRLRGDGPSSVDALAVGEALLASLRPGDLVVLGDGAVTLTVGAEGTATVVTGGRVQGRPGVATRPERVPDRSPTPADLALVDALRGAPVDWVAVSFVRSAADVAAVRAALGPDGPGVVAKVETAEAVEDLAAVIEASEAVMVARGDLGIRVPLEDVPHLQRRIVRTCVDAGRPVITATQVLESMVRAPTPTRAEVADIAAAVEDGTDALMLSAETAIGHDPVAVVRTMARVAERAEAELDPDAGGRRAGAAEGRGRVADAIAAAAWRAAHDAAVGAIVCRTRTGTTARAVARLRPAAPLVGLTPSPATARRLALSWGVVPVVDGGPSTAPLHDLALGHCRRLGLVHPGDVVAVVAASSGAPGALPDDLRLVEVPEPFA